MNEAVEIAESDDAVLSEHEEPETGDNVDKDGDAAGDKDNGDDKKDGGDGEEEDSNLQTEEKEVIDVTA